MKGEVFKAAFKADLEQLVTVTEDAAWCARQMAKSIEHDNVDMYHFAAAERSAGEVTRLCSKLRELILQFQTELPAPSRESDHPFARKLRRSDPA